MDINSGGNHKETGKKCPVKQKKKLSSDIPVAKVKQIFQVGKIDPTLSNVLVCSWGGVQKTRELKYLHFFIMWTSINLPYDSDLGSEGKAEDIPPWRTKIDNLEWVKNIKCIDL